MPDQAPKPEEFSNGQPSLHFSDTDFEMDYPNWPNIDTSALPNPEKTKVAVSNEGCTFLLNVAPLPERAAFKDYVEQQLQDQTKNSVIRITAKDIGEKTAHVRAEIHTGNILILSETYEFLTSKSRYFGVGLVASPEVFNRVCAPLMREMVGSVVVK